jgi:hypothetical protein
MFWEDGGWAASKTGESGELCCTGRRGLVMYGVLFMLGFGGKKANCGGRGIWKGKASINKITLVSVTVRPPHGGEHILWADISRTTCINVRMSGFGDP